MAWWRWKIASVWRVRRRISSVGIVMRWRASVRRISSIGIIFSIGIMSQRRSIRRITRMPPISRIRRLRCISRH
jgi:hypothetical protein